MEPEWSVAANPASPTEATSEARLPWHVWVLAWLCTSLTGGFFGAMFMLLQGGAVAAAGAGFSIGFYLAGLFGAAIVPVFGLLSRLMRLRGGKSLFMMTVAGGTTGLVSGVILGPLCLLTCVCGAFGAALPGKLHLQRARPGG